MTSHIRIAGAKALSCAVVLVGLAVPAASAFTLIELLVDGNSPRSTPISGTPTSPGAPAGMAVQPNTPPPKPLLLPAVQKVRDNPPPASCDRGQPGGPGCQSGSLATPSAPR
jgi:hypothetical protein